jgi:hypothetical protein
VGVKRQRGRETYRPRSPTPQSPPRRGGEERVFIEQTVTLSESARLRSASVRYWARGFDGVLSFFNGFTLETGFVPIRHGGKCVVAQRGYAGLRAFARIA